MGSSILAAYRSAGIFIISVHYKSATLQFWPVTEALWKPRYRNNSYIDGEKPFESRDNLLVFSQ